MSWLLMGNMDGGGGFETFTLHRALNESENLLPFKTNGRPIFHSPKTPTLPSLLPGEGAKVNDI